MFEFLRNHATNQSRANKTEWSMRKIVINGNICIILYQTLTYTHGWPHATLFRTTEAPLYFGSSEYTQEFVSLPCCLTCLRHFRMYNGARRKRDGRRDGEKMPRIIRDKLHDRVSPWSGKGETSQNGRERTRERKYINGGCLSKRHAQAAYQKQNHSREPPRSLISTHASFPLHTANVCL